MPSLTCFKFRFTPNWPLIILAILVIGLFLRLGFWQIQRADEKKEMLAKELRSSQQQPIAWKDKSIPLQYQKIVVQGQFLNHLFFLDNQHHHHRFGFDVLSPLQLANGEIVIVDRGWVQNDNLRLSKPEITIPQQFIKLQGSVYYPNEKQWVLGVVSEQQNKNTTIVQHIDTKLLGQILQKKVYPFIIRLDKQEAYGFVRDWAIVSMPPERHLAYALQWFVMALVIFIICVALNLKKKK